MAQGAGALGDFLRARRTHVRPEDVGLVAGKRRRVPGLRREELATLAGISSTYYLRLEQGRVRHPSNQVLEALARALRLDARAAQHLRDLTGPAEAVTSEDEVAAHGIADMINEFLMPAIVVNRYRDILAANPLARALSPEFAPGQNLVRYRLLEPAAREFYVNWDEATAVAVSALRELGGHFPSDPKMQALIAELFERSARFRALWPRAEVGDRLGTYHIRHPQVGDLYLSRTRLDAAYFGGDHVLMYRAQPGSESAEALERLRSLADIVPKLGSHTRNREADVQSSLMRRM